MHDLRYACRMLLKAPAVTAMAVVALALGIGTTSAIFAFINATLVRPLPGIGDPDRVVTIGRTVDGEGFDNSSYPNYLDLRDQNTVFSDVAALKPAALSLTTPSRAVRLAGAVVTGNYFRALGVRFARGGPFADEPDPAHAGSAAAVISHAVWAQHFGLDADIVGRKVAVNGHPFEIAGVTEGGFRGTDATSPHDVWLPLSALKTVPIFPACQRDIDWFQTRGGVWIMLYARLKPGTSLDQARAQVRAIAERLRAYPENEKNGWTVAPGAGLDPADRRQVVRVAGLLFAAVGVLFVLACANVATLTLSRVSGRAREIAVRLAVGASRRRIVRQLLTESLLLALFGGAAGVLVAFWATAGMARLFIGSARFPLAVDLTPDVRVLAFAVATSGVAGVLVGLVPALQSSRTALVPVLKATAAAARRPSRLRRALVVAQLTLSTVLLVGAGLLLQSVRAFNGIQPGFDATDLMLLSVEPSVTGRYDDAARLRLFHSRLLERVLALPGIDAATLARVAPVTPRGYGTRARVLDKPGSSAETSGLQFNSVAPNYFDVMRIPILRGRALGAGDTTAASPVVVVNEVAARRFWPGEDAIGKAIWVDGEPTPRQVVGVAAVVKYRNLVERSYPLAYYSIAQPYPMPEAPIVLHVRTRLPAWAVAAEIEHAVHAIDPDVPVFDVKTVARHVADSYWQQRLIGIVIGILAALALVLGSVGMYGVVAYAAAERTSETGIRLTLGATRADILRLFTFDAIRLVGLGIALGVMLARAAARLLATLLFGVTAGDPVTYTGAVSLLALVALAACLAPAVRAARVDPMVAVRAE
jgi:putative ABC transport system permease protein